MAYSIITTVGNGTSQYPINFTLGFNSRTEVRCRVNNEVDGLGDPVYKTLTWINDGLVEVADGPYDADDDLVFTRTVDKTELIHDYQDGEPIDEVNLDESNKQNLMAIHEILDGRLESPLANDLDMGGFRIINMAPAEDPDDAVTFEQIEEVVENIADINTIAANIANVNIVAGIDTEITTVAGISANVTTVAGISAAVTTVAGISAAVSTVSGIAANVTTVAGVAASITTLAPIAANITTVAGIAANVTTVAGISAAVSNVSSISAAVSNVSSISAAVSGVNTIAANVTTVAGISANVTTVAGISAAVTTVAGVSAAVSTVSTNIASVNTVSAAITNVNTVATNIANVNTVAGISANVTTVAGISANVTTVAGISANVTTVAGIASDVTTVATIGTKRPSATDSGSQTFALVDADTVQIYTGAGGHTWTIPTNGAVAFPTDSEIEIFNKTANNLTLTASATVTVNRVASPGTGVTIPPDTGAMVKKIGTNEWLHFGPTSTEWV